MSKVSFFTVLFAALFATYLIVASLIAFFTVKIIGIPIGKRMLGKIVLSIVSFVPLYLLLAFLLSRFIGRDLRRLEESVRDIPFKTELGGSWIKEIDRLSEVISSQSRRIKEIIELQRLTLYRIAHDLRTPLTNVRNVILAVKEGVIGSDEVDRYLGKVVSETDRMKDLLEEALSGMKKVSRETEREEVDICALVRDIADLWSMRLRKEGMSLKISCGKGIRARLSPSDLEEILNNLLENSLKHAGSGDVRLSVRKEDRWVLVELRDSGRGLSTSTLQEAYRRGSLGLYIVRELTWRNGGSIDIESSEEGTRIALKFPLA